MTVYLAGVWLIACVAAIVWPRMTCTGSLKNECQLLWLIYLAALSFPVSVVWWLIVSLIATGAEGLGAPATLDQTIEWLAMAGFVLLGLLQWFYILPRSWRWAQRRG